MFNKIIEDIKSLKIQGAENVAKAAVKALRDVSLKNQDKNEKELLLLLMIAKEKLFNTRPTEPALRNSLNFILNDVNEDNIKLKVKKNIEKAIKHFITATNNIAKVGANKIKNGMKVYTHCHSSTVMAILMEAKKQGKKFEVLNTETRPKLQGRITAQELSDNGIKVTHYVDSAAKIVIKQADLILFGSDAITTEGTVINKIGSGMFAELADKYDVPIYCATNSWKFDPKSIFGFDEEIEMRDTKEVWDKPPKNVTIKNPAFEEIEAKYVTGIISEIGIYNPETFISELRRFYPWMFKK